jgi:hypothetical protein
VTGFYGQGFSGTSSQKTKDPAHAPAFVKTTAGQGDAESAEKRKEEDQKVRRAEGQEMRKEKELSHAESQRTQRRKDSLFNLKRFTL